MDICGNKPTERLGIFGGAFNPPHFGHLRSALEVREALNLQHLLFLPAGGHPFKQGKLAAGHHRLAMMRLAVGEMAGFGVCDLEISRQGLSYTVDTLATLHHRFPDKELYFLLGADLFAELHHWKSWQRLIELAHLCVMVRPGYEELLQASPAAQWLNGQSALPNRWIIQPVTALGISSSDIRQRLTDNRSIRFLTPDPVVGYIQQHGLYKGNPYES
ncbi:MAG: nicotinate (nicotinamide) nucleotide adenylyltransferase [Magnetococcales bacterium]|nr:nicotinate (nicotinamide) nucleotide adenylyltransferase [Magnetococcales bacterium]NGZ29205.1 nicotinate (nicotinamide) nucleotide adenylyltransferase [Magnetococcales bacterium]